QLPVMSSVGETSFLKAKEALDAGYDVEINYIWKRPPDYMKGAGHVAMVTEISCLNDGGFEVRFRNGLQQNPPVSGFADESRSFNADGTMRGPPNAPDFAKEMSHLSSFYIECIPEPASASILGLALTMF